MQNYYVQLYFHLKWFIKTFNTAVTFLVLGNHPYRCDHCSFTCVQKVQLTSHMRTHTGEKPFRCDQCAYAAAWNVQLKEHKKVHELNTAVTCGYCGIVVKNENCLNMHVKKEHSSLNNRGQV